MTAHAILVVDDEPASLRAVQRALVAVGDVVTAASGAEALACLTGRRIALLIADQRMPRMLGTEVLAHCATTHPEVIRVLLTGYTDVDTLLAAINAGHVYAYLTKPWDPGALRLVVQRGLEHYDGERERRRLLRDTAAACARAERQAAQKARLLALAAHELGTPLHVAANALALAAYEPLAPGARQWVETARRAVAWLGRSVTQLGLGRQCLAGPLAVAPQPLDAAALITDTAAEFARVCGARHLRLQVDVASALPGVRGDPVWLRRALANLIGNAVRCTPDGGSITVAAVRAGDVVEVSVTDTGTGIEATRLPDLFEPFAAVHGDLDLHTSGAFDFGARGLGLGLAITRAVVEAHGGRVEVASAPGAGSRFALTVPVTGS